MSKDECYYVEYLGWKETPGLHGREFTDPIVVQLLRRTRGARLPRLTLKIGRDHVAITQEVIGAKKKGGKATSSAKAPEAAGRRTTLVAARDVAFSVQSPPPDADVVACVFLGYNELTRCAAHVHVYRFDLPGTARLFDARMRDLVGAPEHWQRMLDVEAHLAEMGHLRLRRGHPGCGGVNDDDDRRRAVHYLSPAEALRLRGDIEIRRAPHGGGDDPLQRAFASVNEELAYKLRQQVPLLLPPKDYDNVVRSHGNLNIRDEVKSLHASIVGNNAIFASAKAVPFSGGRVGTASGGNRRLAEGITEEEEGGEHDARESDGRDGRAPAGLATGDVGPRSAVADHESGNGGAIYSEIKLPGGGCGSGGDDETPSDLAMYSYAFSYGHDGDGDRSVGRAIGRTESMHSWQGHPSSGSGVPHVRLRSSRSMYAHSAAAHSAAH